MRGVDLDVDAGEIVGFLGPNGAGKTTTLRMLTTLLRPTRGEATVAGADLRRDPGAVRRASATSPSPAPRSGEARAGEEVVDHALLYGVERSVADRARPATCSSSSSSTASGTASARPCPAASAAGSTS